MKKNTNEIKELKGHRQLHDLIDEYFDIKPGQFLALGVGDGESEFSRYGCEIVRPLASAVETVPFIVFRARDNKVISHGEVRVCHEVLDAHHNGTVYYVNERGDSIPEWDVK